MLLSTGGPDVTIATTAPLISGQTASLKALPASLPPIAASTTAPVTGTNPLTGVPALNSLPGARDAIYLNFGGDFVASFGQWSNITTPAYDQDGNPSSFSDGELASIKTIWSAVAEDFAPFNINVTTAPPSSMAHGVTEKVDIGGDGAWTGGKYGGISYVGDFTSISIPNVVFVFSANLISNNVPGNPVYTGDAISHEVGHAFGLNHQSTYSGTTLTQAYNTGPGDGTAPLMGSSYAAARSLWWYGTSSVSSTTYQDDMAVIAGARNGFGYRPEPANTTPATATALTVQNGNQVSASGLIIHPSDRDYFSFTSGAGAVSFTVSVTAGVNNLAPKIELLTASGSPVATSTGSSATNFSASINATLTSGGTYQIVVTSSDGHYGNVGQYSIRGTIVTPGSSGSGTGAGTGTGTGQGTTPASTPVVLDPPASLRAVVVNSYRIGLTWSNVPGATGFVIYRTSNGATWINVGTTGLGVTAFTDPAVTPGASYAYAVCAFMPGLYSAPSPAVWVAAPALPVPPSAVANVAVVSVGPRQVVLGWQPGSGAQGYLIQRSTNGRTWTVVGRLTGSGSTSFTDSTVGPGRTYAYRVLASNTFGLAPASRATRVVTPRIAPVRPMRRKTR